MDSTCFWIQKFRFFVSFLHEKPRPLMWRKNIYQMKQKICTSKHGPCTIFPITHYQFLIENFWIYNKKAERDVVHSLVMSARVQIAMQQNRLKIKQHFNKFKKLKEESKKNVFHSNIPIKPNKSNMNHINKTLFLAWNHKILYFKII